VLNFIDFQPLASSAPFPVARRLSLSHDSSQPPGAPKFKFREPSPSSLFLDDATGATSLQDRPYHILDGVAVSPPVWQAFPEHGQSAGAPKTVIRIDPPPVQHSPIVEEVIASLEQPLQSIVLRYCGDSAAVQIQALETILEYRQKSPPAAICGVQRRNGLAKGGILSVTCFICPPNERPRFTQRNAVRIFAEHLVHHHLQVENPFICFARCGKTFPYSQDRDRHEKNMHQMYRPKAHEALETKMRELGPSGSNLPPTTPSATHLPGSSSSTQSTRSRPANVTGPRLPTRVADHRRAPYPSVHVSTPVVAALI
jgi:hypothetical protein